METTTIRARSAAALSAALMLLAISNSVDADSACKGLEEAACGAIEACRWQAGYTRKDGVEVKSHCRSTGKKTETEPVAAPAVDAPLPKTAGNAS